jgi:hypothetical protein
MLRLKARRKNFMRSSFVALAVLVTLTCNDSFAAETEAAVTESAVLPDSPLEFPRELKIDGASVIVHVPQIDTWEGFATVAGRFAVEVTPTGEADAILGVAEFVADTDANLEMRVVAVENLAITVTSFPVEDDAWRVELDGLIRSAFQARTHYIPLDVVLSYIAPEASLPEEQGLSFEPPPIFYSDSPAVLLMTDGEPMLAPIEDTRLEFVVNTNWDLFKYREKEWYLRHGKRWLKAKSLDGSWKFDNSLPGDFKKLPDDENWAQVRAANPPLKDKAAVPVVYVSDRPAELIVTEGQPGFSTITAGGLEYVHDTESDLFRYDNVFYYLVSGRWFSATVLRGPWQHVKELPDEFAAIPPTSDKAHVLAAVPGSDEARLAVLEASIPRKATISRDAGANVAVHYQGDPLFEPIEGTYVERAVNSSGDVLMLGDLYFLCQEAIWYTADSAAGPWTVADSVPAAIYTIPPSSASYHVTHVHVYESDDDTVSSSYTSGYFGIHVGFGVAMYGSGHYYPPYYGYGSYYGYSNYPYYYSYPYSYGASAWYNPNTGMYGRSGSVYGPYGGYGRGASYNPQTGAYARGAAVWDSNEIAGSGFAYNPRTGTGIATNRYANENGGWGESLVTHNDKWVQTKSEWNDYSRKTELLTSGGVSGEINRSDVGGSIRRSGEFQRGDQSLNTGSIRGPQGAVVGIETGDGTRVGAGRSADGDLYAGKDGQVYKRGEDGWQQRSEDGWNNVELSEDRAAQVNQARAGAAERREGLSSMDNSDFSDRGQSGDRWSDRSYDSSRARSSFDSNRRSELNRSFDARTNGYQRFDQRSSAGAGGGQRSRNTNSRRRRQ